MSAKKPQAKRATPKRYPIAIKQAVVGLIEEGKTLDEVIALFQSVTFNPKTVSAWRRQLNKETAKAA